MSPPATPTPSGWPRSLFGRHLLLIAVLVVAGQFCAALLVRQLIVTPRLAQAAEGAVRQVAALRSALQAVPVAQRAPLVQAFNAEVARSIASAPDGAPGQPPTRLERRYLRALDTELAHAALAAPDAPTAWRRDDAGIVSVRVDTSGDTYWVALPRAFPTRVFGSAWLAATIAGVLLALAGAWWLQRQLHRPLQRAVKAAAAIPQALARGAAPEPLPECGPLEIARVARGINQMALQLRQAEQERTEMLAGISHDLRTPLTKLRLALEIAHPGLEPALADRMSRSLDQMDALVEQFLGFARAGSDSEPRTELALDALAQTIADAQAVHGRQLQLELAAPQPLALQALALRRGVDNLVENAWRHGRQPVRLTTGCDAAQGMCWIEVIDHGPGLSATEADRLRQPFARGDARSGPPGAGLGLAIAERVARSHGGTLVLSPAPGAGLSARIVLPTQAQGRST